MLQVQDSFLHLGYDAKDGRVEFHSFLLPPNEVGRWSSLMCRLLGSQIRLEVTFPVLGKAQPGGLLLREAGAHPLDLWRSQLCHALPEVPIRSLEEGLGAFTRSQGRTAVLNVKAVRDHARLPEVGTGPQGGVELSPGHRLSSWHRPSMLVPLGRTPMLVGQPPTCPTEQGVPREEG